MNDAEYNALVQSANDGRLVIGVDRIFARKLYTEASTSALGPWAAVVLAFAEMAVVL